MGLNSYYDKVNQKIKENAPMNNKEIIKQNVDDWLSGGNQKRKKMLAGKRYYNCKNDIINKQKLIIGEYGELVPVRNLSNNKLVHPFLRDLIDQKAHYIMGKPFSLQFSKQEEETEAEKYKRLENFFSTKIRNLLRMAVKESMIKGIAWLHIYYNVNQELIVDLIDSEQLIPIWADSRHTKLESMIRVVDTIEYAAKEKTKVTYVEHWTLEGKTTFVYDKVSNISRLSQIGETEADFLSFKVHEDKVIEETPKLWGKIPFIALKFNDEEEPLLTFIKSLIDEYDTLISEAADVNQDMPNSILVVKNYDGVDVQELRRNLSTFRTIKIAGDGAVSALTIPVDTTAVEFLTERVRNNIYTHGRGFDAQSLIMSNVAEATLRHAYSQMDLDAAGIENNFNIAIDELLYFLEIVNNEKTPYKDYRIIFNKDIMISEESAINMCNKSKNIISDKTIITNHPWVQDARDEELRLEEERKALAEQESDAINSYLNDSKSKAIEGINKVNETAIADSRTSKKTRTESK